MILRRYQRDLNNTQSVPVPAENEAFHFSKTALKDGQKIYLEDLDLTAKPNTETDAWADIIAKAFFTEEKETSGDENSWLNMFKERFTILPDNVFDFLAETATEIRARIRIEEGTRTVQSGALWYEEYLPAETLLWGNIAADRPRKPGHLKNTKDDMLALLPASERLQIGGKATVGSGQVRWILQTK